MTESKTITDVAETWWQRHVCRCCNSEFEITKDEVCATWHDEFLFCECPECGETCILMANYLPYEVVKYADKKFLSIKWERRVLMRVIETPEVVFVCYKCGKKLAVVPTDVTKDSSGLYKTVCCNCGQTLQVGNLPTPFISQVKLKNY